MADLDPAPQTSAPPLFASLFAADGSTRGVLVWPGSNGEPLPVGAWDCEVRTPGGAEAVGTIEVGPETSATELHSMLLSLFRPDLDPQSLWKDGAAQDIDSMRSRLRRSDLEIQVWNHSDQPLPPSDWRIDVEGGPGRALSVSVRPAGPVQSFSVEVDVEGEPVILVMRTNDVIVFDLVVRNDVPRLAPRVASPAGSHTAYWGFQRQGWADAAFAAAADMLYSLEKGIGVTADNVIAAGHAIVRYRKLWGHEPLVATLLKQVPGNLADVELISWVMDFEKGGDEELFRSRLPDLLAALSSRKPYYSESLRLFHERMRTGIDVAEQLGNGPLHGLRSAAAHVERLVASTYWDVEHLTYRGSSPAHPDPEAKAVASNKKKSSLTI